MDYSTRKCLSSERVFSLLKGLVSPQMSGTDQVMLDAEATIVAEKKHISAAAVGRSQALKTAGEQASRKKRPRQSVSTSGIVLSGMDAEEEDDDVQ